MEKQFELTKAEFLKSVVSHSMVVAMDDGDYRHLIFSNHGSSIYRFEVVTVPGYLFYSGDMGAFAFTRVRDMFTFFRNDLNEINPAYWSEKVVAENMNGGIQKFSIVEFRKNVIHSVRAHLSLEDCEAIPFEVMEDIQPLLDSEDEIDAICQIRDFRSHKVSLHDWWEFSNEVYTYNFLWCCYALVWAISQYDAWKEKDDGKES